MFGFTILFAIRRSLCYNRFHKHLYGGKIHEKCGNSLILLCQFLQKLTLSGLCTINGGSADNAIPADAEAVVFSEKSLDELKQAAEAFRAESAASFNAPAEYHIEISPDAGYSEIIDPAFTETFLRLAATVPNEVFDTDQKLGIVKTSSNFASVHTSRTYMEIHTSQRSLEDAERQKITELIRAHFAPLNGTTCVTGEYPGWPANADSAPVKVVGRIHEQIYGEQPGVYAVHAGLETGAFAKKNPSLQIISFGPPEEDIHTEREWMDLKKFEEFNHLLRIIVEQAGTQGN